MGKEKKYQIGHKKRIQERYASESLENFEPYEVLELVLSITNVRKDTKLLAKAMIDRFGGLSAVMNAPVEDLRTFPEIGLKTATTIKLFKDVNVYLLRDKITKLHIFTSVNDVKNYLILKYRGYRNEEFRVLYLNSKNILLKDAAVSTGIVSKTLIDFRLIANEILNISATAVIVLHNHPSGDNKPSEQDIVTTQNLKKFLKYLSVRLLDHFIVGYDEIFSFADEGLL